MIRATVGPNAPLLLASGVRRGSDIIAALCMGGVFVLTGRATLYGATADGLTRVKGPFLSCNEKSIAFRVRSARSISTRLALCSRATRCAEKAPRDTGTTTAPR